MKFVDLFCGGGFGARGAISAGATPILAVDAWDLAAKTYADNFPGAKVICSPIEDLSPTELAETYKPDVLLTSPECTSHSLARGARPGSEKSRETAIGIVPWLEAMEPRWLIVENVNRMKRWSRHNELVETIESYGYTVNDLLLNAADFGTAQSRKRMFLLCSKDGIRVNENDLVRANEKSAVARDIIDWDTPYKTSPLYQPNRAQPTIERAERAIAVLGANVPFIIVYYSSDRAGGWQRLEVPLRTITTVDRFGLVTWQDGSPRLRMLQPPELKEAMGAGSEHKLDHGNRRDKVKLCGNGVCSPVIEALFRTMKKFDVSKKDEVA